MSASEFLCRNHGETNPFARLVIDSFDSAYKVASSAATAVTTAAAACIDAQPAIQTGPPGDSGASAPVPAAVAAPQPTKRSGSSKSKTSAQSLHMQRLMVFPEDSLLFRCDLRELFPVPARVKADTSTDESPVISSTGLASAPSVALASGSVSPTAQLSPAAGAPPTQAAVVAVTSSGGSSAAEDTAIAQALPISSSASDSSSSTPVVDSAAAACVPSTDIGTTASNDGDKMDGVLADVCLSKAELKDDEVLEPVKILREHSPGVWWNFFPGTWLFL